MCVVSFIGDHYIDKWQPIIQPIIQPNPTTTTGYTFNFDGITRAEFDALKKEVAEMKALIAKAKIYDKVNNEPNCENDGKMAILRKIAEAVGIDLDEVLKKE